MRLITAFVASALVAASSHAQSAERIMDRAVNNYSGMKSMRVEFRQTITNPLTGTTAVSTGELLRRQPNLLAINFTNPKGDRIVADGKAVWVYLPSTAPGQVVKLTKGSREATMVDPQSLFLSSPRARFNISSGGTEVVGGVSTTIVNLVPKSSSAPFTHAKVWIDAATGTVKQLEVTEPSGLKRFVIITRIVSNPAIAPSAFKFTPPPRVRILDSAALGGM